MNGWVRRSLGALLIGVFLPVSSIGCFGKFELTRKVYNWNTSIDQDKWVRWFAFLLLMLIPYPLAITIDTLLGNSVEFWTGENPITAGEPRVIQGANGEVVTLERRGEDVIDVTVQRGCRETLGLGDGDGIGQAQLVNMRYQRGHAVITQAACVYGLRDKIMTKGMHLHHRRQAGGIAIIIAVLTPGERRACCRFNAADLRVHFASQFLPQEREGEATEIGAAAGATHQQIRRFPDFRQL